MGERRQELRKGTKTGTETRTDREGQQGQNGTGNGTGNCTGNGERGGRREWGGQWYTLKKGVRWWRMCQSTGSSTRGRVLIRFGTYNIHNGHNGVLESALRGVSNANMYMGIFKETKVTDGIYTRGLDGYIAIDMDAPIRQFSVYPGPVYP